MGAGDSNAETGALVGSEPLSARREEICMEKFPFKGCGHPAGHYEKYSFFRQLRPRKAATSPAKSSGQGDSKRMVLCRLGCWKPRRTACRAWRENSVAAVNAASSGGLF